MNLFCRTSLKALRSSYLPIYVLPNKTECIHKILNQKYHSLSFAYFRNGVSERNITYKRNYEISSNIESDDELDELLRHDEILARQSISDLLYPKSQDVLIVQLNECISIQDVLNFIHENAAIMKKQHVAQAVLVLWDLQKMFTFAYQINRIIPSDANYPITKAGLKEHISQLVTHPDFQQLLDLVKTNFNEFDVEELSCILLYLNKMGLNTQHDVLKLLISKLSDSLKTNITLSALSRFIVAIYTPQKLGFFMLMQDAMPVIREKLDNCETASDLKLLTICLNNLNRLVTKNFLEKYKVKVKELVDNNQLTSQDSRIILKVIAFLSHHQWNDQNAVLTSQMMLLLKNNLHTLNIFDFFIVYEILYKNHEPGDLLTEMQRCATRLLVHLDEESNDLNLPNNFPFEVRLKLLSCIVCFSSPRNRPQYEKSIISKYMKGPLTRTSMFDLLRILTFIKPDNKICEMFWNNVLKTVQDEELFKNNDMLLKLCHKYMNYSNDTHYRHEEFETQMMVWIWNEIENGIMNFIPSKFSVMASFIFAYGNNEKMIDYCSNKMADIWEQLNHMDCLYISKGLRRALEMSNNAMSRYQTNLINNILNKCIHQHLLMKDGTKVNYLLKTCIYKKNTHRTLVNDLLSTVKADRHLSSNLIRNVIFSLQSTNGLLPDVIDNIADYVINYRDHLLGFNAEKVSYMCYYLGYLPKNSDELFHAITDIIIRDQERISGLSYIQAALSLSFFYKLPESFIKQIFNVAFLEKLDSELAVCYFKDVYPVRVRHMMMQLNRAVCLDYPQSNVPWFHQKYIDKLHFEDTRESSKELEMITSIRNYLLQIVGSSDYLFENFKTPYGYYIDFLIYLNNDAQLVKVSEDDHSNKIAILLMKPAAYTNINVQLKGQYQLKKRHLEILGYNVLTVNMNEWNSLIYGEEKMAYFTKFLWPDNYAKKCIKEIY